MVNKDLIHNLYFFSAKFLYSKDEKNCEDMREYCFYDNNNHHHHHHHHLSPVVAADFFSGGVNNITLLDRRLYLVFCLTCTRLDMYEGAISCSV